MTESFRYSYFAIILVFCLSSKIVLEELNNFSSKIVLKDLDNLKYAK